MSNRKLLSLKKNPNKDQFLSDIELNNKFTVQLMDYKELRNWDGYISLMTNSVK